MGGVNHRISGHTRFEARAMYYSAQAKVKKKMRRNAARFWRSKFSLEGALEEQVSLAEQVSFYYDWFYCDLF
jgi:hypothetical protein